MKITGLGHFYSLKPFPAIMPSTKLPALEDDKD